MEYDVQAKLPWKSWLAAHVAAGIMIGVMGILGLVIDDRMPTTPSERSLFGWVFGCMFVVAVIILFQEQLIARYLPQRRRWKYGMIALGIPMGFITYVLPVGVADLVMLLIYVGGQSFFLHSRLKDIPIMALAGGLTLAVPLVLISALAPLLLSRFG